MRNIVFRLSIYFAAYQTRCITEITNSDLPFCKELMKITGGLRHLEGVKANFMVSEKEYLLTPLGLSYNGKSQQQGKSLSRIVYSNLKEIVEQQHYLSPLPVECNLFILIFL